MCHLQFSLRPRPALQCRGEGGRGGRGGRSPGPRAHLYSPLERGRADGRTDATNNGRTATIPVRARCSSDSHERNVDQTTATHFFRFDQRPQLTSRQHVDVRPPPRCTAREMHCTGLGKKVVPRLRECFRQSQAGVASNSGIKIHQTWVLPFSRSLHMHPYRHSPHIHFEVCLLGSL